MPISYEVDPSGGIIRERWHGTPTTQDIFDHWTIQMAEDEAMSVRVSLVDLRDGDIEFSGADLQRSTSTILEPAMGDRKRRATVIVRDPVQHGVSRAIHGLCGEHRRSPHLP
jgi:hypothetical protein